MTERERDAAKTLHELSSRHFNRSPDGSIFTSELKTVFSLMLISLELKEKRNTGTVFQLFSNKKVYPFSFTIEEAIEVLKNLNLDVNMNSTSIHISYAMKPELGFQLLNTFMEAKLLHAPMDRTRTSPKGRICLQPTPKGVAVLCSYTKKMAIKDLPPILKSDFNSMRLFEFERNPIDDSIIHSKYFINLLFKRIMGPRPNIWSPKNSFDKLPKLSKLLEPRNHEVFTFEYVDLKEFKNETNFSIDVFHKISGSNSSLESMNLEDGNEMENENRTSPFAHRYFSNPDSDAHVQYYVSDPGVRLFAEKFIDEIESKVDICFTTKALWQWLMECTDIMYPKEAVFVASLFLKYGLMMPVYTPSGSIVRRKFVISKKSFFTLSNLGLGIVRWNYDADKPILFSKNSKNFLHLTGFDCRQRTDQETPNLNSAESLESQTQTEKDGSCASTFERISLKEVLADPGIRYLFRAHLSKDFCLENLDVYSEITKFMNKMLVLKQLMNSKTYSDQYKQELSEWRTSNNSQLRDSVQRALVKQIDECLSLAYNIYSSYIASGSPHQLNIDHEIREQITRLISSPSSYLDSVYEGHMITHSRSMCDSKLPLSDEYSTSTFSHDGDDRTVNDMQKFKLENSPFFDNDLTTSLLVDTSSSKDSNCRSILKTSFLLLELNVLFEEIREKTYVMMKNDSLPKFLASEAYKEATQLLPPINR